jgi:DNA topoisomerase-1
MSTPTEEAEVEIVSDDGPGITRRRSGKGFSYRTPDGAAVKDKATLARIRKLAIPPAYADVWIAPSEKAHIQATGRDARGRKQYRYHPAFIADRESTKYEHMLEFAEVLPDIRARVDADMRKHGLPREKVLAVIVRLLDTTLIRIGNADYAKSNKSFGLTTLRDRHVDINGTKLRFAFRGKSGKEWNLAVSDRRVARIVRDCQDLPGQHLFQYLGEDGERQKVTSSDVNGYLREITGRDVTAKDFRTWAGTVLAAMAFSEFEAFDSATAAKRNVRAAIERVAARLGNTPTICRKCYVHPAIVDAYVEGELAMKVVADVESELRDRMEALNPEEVAVLTFLRQRLKAKARNGG